jgi:hypothetical protein
MAGLKLAAKLHPVRHRGDMEVRHQNEAAEQNSVGNHPPRPGGSLPPDFWRGKPPSAY